MILTQQLIVGIDPGTTVGFALLDVSGNILQVTSGKQWTFELLLKEIVSHGRVLLVGTDKAKVPELVSRFATKVGARVVKPKEDLRIEEKRRMTNVVLGSRKPVARDSHQLDAVASALLAQQQYTSLFDKIEKQCRKQNALDSLDEVRLRVVRHKINITKAITLVRQKDTIEKKKVVKPVRKVEQPTIVKTRTNDDRALLISQIKKLTNGLTIQKKKVKRLQSTLSHLKENPTIVQQQVLDKLEHEKKRIIQFSNALHQKNQQLLTKEKELSRAAKLLLAHDIVFMPYLQRLSFKEVKNLKNYEGVWVWLKQGFVVPEKTSKAIEHYRFLVEKGKLNNNLNWFPANTIKHSTFLDIVGVKKKDLGNCKRPIILQHVIKEYKKEREKELG